MFVTVLIQVSMAQDNDEFEDNLKAFDALMEAFDRGDFDADNPLTEITRTGNSDIMASLMYAADQGNLIAVQAFVEIGARVNLASIVDRKTALMYAAYKGHIDVVIYLVEVGGANIYIRDNRNRTALTHAIDGGHIDVANYLVSVGAGGFRGFVCRNLDFFCY